MGIQGYNEWLKTNHPKCFRRIGRVHKYNHCMLDLNFVLHNAIHKSTSMKGFMTRVCRSLDFILSRIIATHSVYVAIDGPPPYSKIALQRKRRAMVTPEKLKGNISSLCLTPGTDLMNELDEHLVKYFHNRSQWFRYRRTRFKISPSSETGEGEVKIFGEIRRIIAKHPRDRFLVVGNDADLVVLAMACQPTLNVDILIRTDKYHQIISTADLLKSYHASLTRSMMVSPSMSELRNDFVVLSIMMGNDYLPRMHYIKVENIQQAYLRTKSFRPDFLINNGTFNSDFLQEMMLDLATTMAKQYQTLNIHKYSDEIVENYLEGLLWCLDMYRKGECGKVDYLLHNRPPNPYEVFYYLIRKNGVIPDVPTSETTPVPSEVYCLLVTPKKARRFLPERYQESIDTTLAPLYLEEECKECIEFSRELRVQHKLLRQLQLEDEDSTDVRREIGDISRRRFSHKKQVHDSPISVEEMVALVKRVAATE